MSRGKKPFSMAEHSEAKVRLYGTYLGVYLNILARTPFIRRIFVFDLLAGEGIYENGQKGSPIVALESIERHHEANGKCPDMELWFNDSEVSQIEPGLNKIDRVRRFADEIKRPSNVTVEYSREDFKIKFEQALRKISTSKNVAALFFIDPYGYKVVSPGDISEILSRDLTEALLFLPVSFMYRFAQKSINEDFPGSEPLRGFLTELGIENTDGFNSANEFISALKEGFSQYLSDKKAYVDTFTLESESNVYALFFFTRSLRGFEKMLEAKWKLDRGFGEGYHSERTSPLFSSYELKNYPAMLENYIFENPNCTNNDLYMFGLKSGFLPAHTNQALKSFGSKLTITSGDGKPVRGNYITYKSDHLVHFQLEEE